jgi:hypothetical protein
MKRSSTLIGLAFWFLVMTAPSGIVQLGPFQTQSACTNAAATLTADLASLEGSEPPPIVTECFSCTAKQ